MAQKRSAFPANNYHESVMPSSWEKKFICLTSSLNPLRRKSFYWKERTKGQIDLLCGLNKNAPDKKIWKEKEATLSDGENVSSIFEAKRKLRKNCVIYGSL